MTTANITTANISTWPTPASAWNYFHVLRDFAKDVIDNKKHRDLVETDADGEIEDSWVQWDAYTDINFWVAETGEIGPNAKRDQVATAYLHPTDDASVIFECGTDLDNRIYIELHRTRL